MRKEEELKSRFVEILAAEGWNLRAMRMAAERLDLDPEYHHILFPDGVAEALDYYEGSLDTKMLESLKTIEVPKKIRDKIALCLNLRIVPRHIPLIKSAWRTCDVIWRFAGDTATDFNHYTKRTLLLGVLMASAKYRTSASFEETDAYTRKNLDRVINIAKLKNKPPKMEDIPILRLFV